MAEYPTERAWKFFTDNLADIRSVVDDYGPIERMQIPNTRVADRVPGYNDTEERDSVPLAKKFTMADFDAAVAARDSQKLTQIMNHTWLRYIRSIHDRPGVIELYHLLDGTVDGFIDHGEEDADDVRDALT